MLMDSLASDDEDGAGLEPDRNGWAVATKVVEEGFEVSRRSLGGSLALEYTLR